MPVSPGGNGKANARNFISYIESGVDPRTGTYSFSFSLSDMLANNLSGPSFSLRLGFDLFNRKDQGFGINWAIPLTYFDNQAKTLYLSNGTSYKAEFAKGKFTLLDNKVKDIVIRKYELSNELIVEHKSGIVEVLSARLAPSNVWRVEKIFSASGKSLNLGYATNSLVLATVSDESQTLVRVDTSHINRPSISIWPDVPEKRLTFSLQIDRPLRGLPGTLRQISLHEGASDAAVAALWAFTYRDISLTRNFPNPKLTVISGVKLPTGATETIRYKEGAFQLQIRGKDDVGYPAVVSHQIVPGGSQPTIEYEFVYSAENYLVVSTGFWSPGSGGIVDYNYRYDSTQTLNVSGVKVVTQRTYDIHHLQVSETVQQNGKTVSTRTEYHSVPWQPVAYQPSNYQLPKMVAVTYFDANAPKVERTELTLTHFDDYGNLLKKVSPSGVTELYEYYPPAGADGCPADALPFVRWLKQKTVLSAPGQFLAPSTVIRYRYRNLPKASADRTHFNVLQLESVFEADSTGKTVKGSAFSSKRFEYNTSISSPFFGQIVRRTENTQGVDAIYDFVYELKDGIVKLDTNMSGKDGVRAQRSSWQDARTGKEIRTRDTSGVVIETTYDRLGRKAVEVVEPGNTGQALRKYAYRAADEYGKPMRIEMTDPKGGLTITSYDGLGREVAIQTQDLDAVGKPMRDVYQATFNGTDQLTQEVHIDWLGDIPCRLTTRYLYDDWGNRRAHIGPDNVTNHDQYDPILLTQSRWRDGMGKTVAKKNLFGKDDKVERIAVNGRPAGFTSYLYDGLGRCVRKTAPQNRVTSFTYDFANRLTTTQLPDMTLIKKEYAQHSAGDYPSQIWVNDYLAGERVYDGLMRVTEVRVGGRVEKFQYAGAAKQPSVHTRASGVVIKYSNSTLPGAPVLQRSVNGKPHLTTTFGYNEIDGQLISASLPSNRQERDYSANGKLITERLLEGGVRHKSGHVSSLRGLPLRDTDASGMTTITRYDGLCRVTEVEQGSVTVRFSYNAGGEIAKTDSFDAASNNRLITELEYDDFGREVRRWLKASGAQVQELAQRFDGNDRLVRRSLLHGNTFVLNERFDYDSRGRLSSCEYSGLRRPLDPHGNTVAREYFRYDEMDNIVWLRTVFKNGSNDATYHYENRDKTQLTRVTHTHPDYAAQPVVLRYDIDGNQLNDERGRQLNYNELGRLASVTEVRP
ncbi:RHS repeat domain-containing protein [Pseudomonas huanghezhanensis]|uniref:hypothetical protein n=1 Tax=Pseudomonas huanghezhanensis TaxID=3002903 RepID=UPI0022861EA5|nr:hypothetical protein [Pseudomonas sp. BSw22131]